MPYRLMFSLFCWILFSPVIAVCQNALSYSETQNFYALIRQTKEYRSIKQTVDSVNKLKDQMPEEIKLEIVSKVTGAGDDVFIFDAMLERRFAIGFTIERYSFHYDRRKKQLVNR